MPWWGKRRQNSATVFSPELPLVESLKEGRVPVMDMGYGGVKGVFAGRRKDGMEYHGESSLVDLIELQRKKKGI